MKAIEKSKVQKIVDKIQQGEFDENDIDNIFMRMRAYSHNWNLFREIADFVAHNDVRNRGITNQSLQAMYYSMKYFTEYVSPKKTLDISKPFPVWIKDLIKYQIDKTDEKQLKERFNVTRSRLKSRVDNGFKDNKSSKTTHIKEGKLSLNSLEAIKYVMSFIISKAAFTQDEVIDDLICVLQHNQLDFIEEYIREKADKITLCILLLLHNSEFDYKGYKPGYCRITSENLSVSHNTRLIDKDGNPVNFKESFGTLQINGHVVLKKDGKDLTISFPIVTTSLSAEEWCDSKLFIIEPLSQKAPTHLCKRLKLDGDLYLTSEFKLDCVDA